ncbi:glycosyltransferase [Bacillaceae bacterium Marseille-Q3522]|nr:glycosyltransferase [Bacillaceae bacterium Marseille-Q3522]
MNIAYVIFCESLFEPILQTQVIQLLKAMSKERSCRLHIYWFCPVKFCLTNKKKIAELQEELAASQIQLRVVPILFLGRWIKVTLRHVPLVYQLIIPLLYLKKKDQIDLFHIRSYPGAIPFDFLKKISFLLDTRSDFVGENTLKYWKNDMRTIKYWLKKERKLYEAADKIIAISKEFAEEKLADFTEKTEIIPNNVSTGKYERDQLFRNEFRKKHHLEGKLIFCYLGSLGNGWNKLDTYLNFFQQNKQLIGNFHFLLLTPDKAEIMLQLKNNTMLKDHCTVESVPNWEVGKYLSAADFGLQFMSHVDSRIGIKVVEYLSAGLPVIVNENVRGAASIIAKNNLGIVMKEEILPEAALTHVLQNYPQYSQKCKRFAEGTFSTDVVAERYMQVYASSLGNMKYAKEGQGHANS